MEAKREEQKGHFMGKGFSFSSDYLNGLGSGKDPSDDGGGGGPPNQKSFRDLVVSQRQLLSPHPNVDLIQQKLARIKYEGGNPMKPMNAMPSNEEAFHQGMYVKISHASTSSDIAHILQSGDVPPDSNNMQA
ncbi:hypothetical protein JHK85_050310 [Glycine max]|nr:hypothetical protein JHK85_050310 [Glycine max]